MTPRVVVHLVYNLAGAGAVEARARTDIAVASARGHRVVAVTDRLAGPPSVGGRVWSAVGPAPWRALPGPGSELAAMYVIWRGLERAMRDARPDVIVFHNSTLAWAALRIARACGARSVFMVHALIRDRLEGGGNPYGPATTRLYKAANRKALLESNRIVCVSRHIARVAEAEGARSDSIRVAPNPVDPDFFRVANGHRDIDVLFVGRLSREKGADVLLDALRGLPGLRVVIAGDGPLREELAAQARSIPASIEFRGRVPRKDLPALYTRAALQVVPSRSEPQGVVVLEALASGTPVVGSAVGGIPEMIDESRNGWLVEPKRPDRLRAAIHSALENRDRLDEMRAAARASIAPYTFHRLSDALAGAYLDE